MLARYQQLVVPRDHRLLVMQSVHEVTHYGFIKNYVTIREKYFWRDMQKDVKDYASSCLVCQQIKSTPALQYPLHLVPVNRNIFERIRIDFHSVPTKTRGSKQDPNSLKHVLVIICQLSQYCLMIPAIDQKAKTAAKLIFENWILRHGTFKALVSDRSTSWLAELFQEFLKLEAMKVNHFRTSSFYPKTNGLCEAVNKSIIRHLRAYCHNKENFHEYLKVIEAAQNNSVNTALGTSPFYLLFGFEYKSPIDLAMNANDQSVRNHIVDLQDLADKMKLLRELVHSNVTEHRKNTQEMRNKTAVEPKFCVGQRVFLNQKFDSRQLQNKKHSSQWLGPFI